MHFTCSENAGSQGSTLPPYCCTSPGTELKIVSWGSGSSAAAHQPMSPEALAQTMLSPGACSLLAAAVVSAYAGGGGGGLDDIFRFLALQLSAGTAEVAPEAEFWEAWQKCSGRASTLLRH